ncbi:MAG: hypothetical protein A3H42_00230 [Deltaproteobacteria bacterium RIFCSPLOWO2_02_FULL_46_8]|nr:MAG: hypothetical protein A3H42_00230 [Deltaproteobacteria bacterium RIFCSPLOWO2_02_FULL_46_8]
MLRLISTIILSALVLATIWFLPLFPFQIVILVATGVGLWEYASLIFQNKGPRFFTLFLGLVFASLMTWYPSREILLIGLLAIVFVTFLWGLKNQSPAGHQNLSETTHYMGTVILGVCYLALTLPFWSWLRELGREWVLLVLLPACFTDTFGFLVGKSIGRHKLAEVISPNKTWEGFFGGLCGGIFGLWLATQLFFQGRIYYWNQTWWHLIIIGASISIVAALGDLFESLIKRSAGVKDASHLIPGHGGALDRLDALIFVPSFFYFLLWYTGVP